MTPNDVVAFVRFVSFVVKPSGAIAATMNRRPPDGRTEGRHGRHPRRAGARRRRAAAGGWGGLRAGAARLRRHAARRADREPDARRGVGSLALRLRAGRGLSRDGASRALAPGAAQPEPRPLQGDRRRLPGPRLRHLQRHLHRRRDRLRGDRSADHRRAGRRGARPDAQASGRQTRHGGDLHAQPRRPLRRRHGRADRGRHCRRRADHRARGLPDRGGQRERPAWATS